MIDPQGDELEDYKKDSKSKENQTPHQPTHWNGCPIGTVPFGAGEPY